MSKKTCDLLISVADVMTMDSDDRIIHDGSIAITNDKIVAVGEAATIRSMYKADKEINLRGMIALPGLIDTYGHAGHGLIKSLYHPDHGWPTNPVYFHNSTPRWWYMEAMLSAIERIRFGVTTGYSVIGATPARTDNVIYAQKNIEAVAHVGSKAVVGVGPPDPFVSHVPIPWEGTLREKGQATRSLFTYEQCLSNTEQIIQDFHRSNDGRIEISLHYPYLLSRQAAHPKFPYSYNSKDIPEMIDKAQQIREIADKHNVLLHSHAFVGSVDFALKEFGEGVTKDLLTGPTLFAHCNGLGEQEIEILGECSTGIAVVPFTHENLWYGVCPVSDLLQAGAQVTVSTDGSAPYTSYDLIGELSRVAWAEWNRTGSQETVLPAKLLRMVTIDAARALNMDERVGSIEVGKQADITVINFQKPHLTPCYSIPWMLSFYANGNDVDTVIVDGEILLQGGQYTNVDLDKVIEDAKFESKKALQGVDYQKYIFS
jgi:cytosine/adenosine deaminase-related metal-dependent hydrolase